MIPPTSIDGTDITGATIDGTDVTEITVDGQTVFTAVPQLPVTGLVHNWDATQETYSDSSTGQTFNDQEGNNDGSATGTTFRTSGINANESFEYDGADDRHTCNQIPLGSGDQATVAAVVDLQATNDRYVFFANNSEPGTTRGFWMGTDLLGNWTVQFPAGSANLVGSTATTGTAIVVFSTDGSNGFLEVDDSLEDSGSISIITSVLDNAYIGTLRPNTAVWDGQIGQVVYYDEFKDSAERSDIYSALSSKWGV